MSSAVNILWTGGWDSTFQILRLLIVDRVEVQPFYIIDEDRPSMGMELLTMKKIKLRALNEFPDCKNLLLPMKVFILSDISENKKITHNFDTVKNKNFIGPQYDWLARFCEEFKLIGLQLCIHEDDKAHVVIKDIVIPRADGAFSVDEKFAGTSSYELFKYYIFPILNLTKKNMEALSHKYKFNHLMNLTWFCHNPQGGKPCGGCNPCKYTAEEGLGWRIPFYRRLSAPIFIKYIHPWKSRLGRVLRKAVRSE